MPYTPLDRQFRQWHGDKVSDEDFRLFDRSFYGDAGWPELLKRQRVVLLAEAGSGKSEELKEQAKSQERAGAFAFHATVQDVARRGLLGAIGSRSARFAEWMRSDQTAWFFVDSFDEAKLDNILLSEALARLSDDIGVGLPRARIILSGRYSSWEFRADLDFLQAALPIAETRPDLPQDESHPLIPLMRDDAGGRRRKVAPEKPLVVLMAPLDRGRVRDFAAGQGVTNLDDFVAALDAANLWSLAQRPLDLSWLVGYWRQNKRFGRFAEMLETSLRQRLGEANPGRSRRDTTHADRSFLALERIGATMVFGRETRIELPDSSFRTQGEQLALRLSEILPDWTGEEQARLLERPVFDPASLGRISLHNDNQGVVRGFLAARWLKRRLEGNAPVAAVRYLLFADADGVPIVLPSARETAAWLSIWNADCAREVIRRDPTLLLTAGDPGSLDAATRSGALHALVARLAEGRKIQGTLDRDVLERFATRDLIPAIVSAWQEHRGDEEVRKLLLAIIAAGQLHDCAVMSVEAVAGEFTDRGTLLDGARALAATADDGEVERFVSRMKADITALDEVVRWELLDLFFPKYFAVDDLLSAVTENERTPATAHNYGWRGRRLIERLTTRVDLENLLQGLLREADPEVTDVDGTGPETPQEKRLAPFIQAAASALIRITPVRESHLAVIDAAIWLSEGRHHRAGRFEDETFQPLLWASIERRRRGLWHAVERLEHSPRVVHWGGLVNLMQLEFAGWPPGLKTEDVAWLIEDARDAATPRHRQLALDGLLGLWRDAGSPGDLLRRIREAAALDQESAATVDARLAPRQLSPDELKYQRESARHDRRRAAEQLKADASWITFVEGLRSDPLQLRTPPANLKPDHVDGRLYHIWRLLYDTLPDQTEYAIDQFGELVEVFGPELTREATQALIRFWRNRRPTLVSARKPNARNQIDQFDCMGIAGVSLEAKADPGWATQLSSAEAIRAAQFSTLELNGFPSWTGSLATAWPEHVREVFVKEAQDHLAADAGQHGFIDKLTYGEPALAALLAPSMLEYITAQPDVSGRALARALEILARALPIVSLPARFVSMALARFASIVSESDAALYLGIAFHADPDAATAALTARLDALDFPAQKQLVEYVLPSIFGDRLFRTGLDPTLLPFPVLERLVSIAFSTIRHADDNVHTGVYSPDQRDDAENARGRLFNLLRTTPGRPTIDALRRLKEDAFCPIPSDRLTDMILERASEDAEHAPWPAFEARAMEEQFDTQPRTPRDLQLVALRRIADIAHDLHNDQFAQGQTVKALPIEREVQKWVAHELDLRKGRAYSITREPHVAEEKEPDIRFQSNATDANMPIEIKVAESWTLPELLAALTTQLTGRYLRERDKRHGVLLLVHQNARPRGWADDEGRFRSFEEVVATLRAEADRLAACGADASQAEIVVIDVSDVATVPAGRQGG